MIATELEVVTARTDVRPRLDRQGYDLLRFRPVKTLSRWWGFPYLFQAALLVSGFVTYELFSEWKAAQEVFLWGLTMVTDVLGIEAYAGWIKGGCALFVVPLVVWLVLSGLVLLFRGARSMDEAWRRLALPLAVLIAVGHTQLSGGDSCSRSLLDQW